MKKVLIIGAGVSGLSTAINLLEKGFDVTLIEKTKNLGGRATSFYNEKTNEWIDIGQHLLLGCYRETFKFLRKINSIQNIKLQKKMSVVFVDKNKQIFKLKSITRVYPFNLILGLLNYRVIKFSERVKILYSIGGFFLKKKKYLDSSISDWLKKTSNSDRSISAFWAPISIGIMNSILEDASLKIFRNALKEIFLKGNKATCFVEQKVSLKELFVDPAVKFIKNNGGNIINEKVEKLICKENVIIQVISDKNNYSNFDYVVSTLLPVDLAEILPQECKPEELKQIKYNPIITAHLWLRNNPFTEKFYGLIDSRIHWVFNHNSYISLVVSAAGEIVNLSNEKIYELFCNELKKYFKNFSEEIVTDYKIIKERKATVVQTPNFVKFRDKLKSSLENLVIIGDWTDTHLPATIESAVKNKIYK